MEPVVRGMAKTASIYPGPSEGAPRILQSLSPLTLCPPTSSDQLVQNLYIYLYRTIYHLKKKIYLKRVKDVFPRSFHAPKTLSEFCNTFKVVLYIVFRSSM